MFCNPILGVPIIIGFFYLEIQVPNIKMFYFEIIFALH